MEQSLNLKYVQIRRNTTEKRTLEEAVELCKAAGFYRFDYRSDSLESALREKDFFDSQSVQVIQTHCPFFRYQEDGLNKFKAEAPKSVMIAAALGAKYFVVHADECRMSDDIPRDKILETTIEYLKPIVDLCGENGLRVAVENVFEESDRSKRTRFCSDAEEIIEVIGSFPGTGIGCCWDSGHHNVSFGEEAFFEKLEILAPYIICTHIHDNRYGLDMHKPVFFGSIDWEKVIETLKRHNYQGDFSWELGYDKIPDALFGDYLKFLNASGNYLLDL